MPIYYTDNIDPNWLKSHSVSLKTLEEAIKHEVERIQQTADTSDATVKQQLEILDELSTFEIGRFIITNKGLNGFWTHYVATYPMWKNSGPTVTGLEKFLLESAPIVLATQQRFQIFLQENQKQIKENARLACVPCGMMGELLNLDYNKIDNIDLIGFDYESQTLNDAYQLAESKHLANYVRLHHRNAWDLNAFDEFDLISSSGLNIYEPDSQKVRQLYEQFYLALASGGKLVTSFMTFPPNTNEPCEWDFSQIDMKALMVQKIVLADVVKGKWQCYQSTAQFKAQLAAIGFKNIEIINDKAKIFPTVVAYK